MGGSFTWVGSAAERDAAEARELEKSELEEPNLMGGVGGGVG